MRIKSLLVLLALAACAPAQSVLPAHPVAAGPKIAVIARPVDETPAGVTQVTVCAVEPCGEFAFAGGLELTSSETSRLHGLSDLDITPKGRLTAVSDDGDLFTARIQLDAEGRLAGLTDGEIAPLTGLDGQPLPDKTWGDAEGLAVMANGDRLVSFERMHRVWRYPAKGGPPVAAPFPNVTLPENEGLEALGPDPAAGVDAYIAGAEDTGQTWLCRLSAACVAGPTLDKPPEFGLVAVRRLDGGRTAWLLRAFDVLRGVRIELRITDAKGAVIDGMKIARPAAVDNFEGLAAVRHGKGYRFYMISDDNFSALQRTLLFAFDWTPPQGK